MAGLVPAIYAFREPCTSEKTRMPGTSPAHDDIGTIKKNPGGFPPGLFWFRYPYRIRSSGGDGSTRSRCPRSHRVRYRWTPRPYRSPVRLRK